MAEKLATINFILSWGVHKAMKIEAIQLEVDQKTLIINIVRQFLRGEFKLIPMKFKKDLKTLGVSIPNSLHKELKIYAVEHDLKLKDLLSMILISYYEVRR